MYNSLGELRDDELRSWIFLQQPFEPDVQRRRENFRPLLKSFHSALDNYNYQVTMIQKVEESESKPSLFPNSKRVYLNGQIHDLKVPMREIKL